MPTELTDNLFNLSCGAIKQMLQMNTVIDNYIKLQTGNLVPLATVVRSEQSIDTFSECVSNANEC